MAKFKVTFRIRQLLTILRYHKRLNLPFRSNAGISSVLLWLGHGLIHGRYLDFLCTLNTHNILTRESSNRQDTSNKNHVYNGNIACDCSLHFSQCKYYIQGTKNINVQFNFLKALRALQNGKWGSDLWTLDTLIFIFGSFGLWPQFSK